MARPRPLSDLVETGAQFARSVNVERDSASGQLDGYLPTARALETTRRVAAAMTNRDLTRAWSVTGPYGSGKSSLALLLDALCGPPADPRRERALTLLAEVDPSTAESMKTALDLVAPANGFVRATVTSQREPAARTMVRAAAYGLERFDGRNRKLGPLLRTAASLLDADVSARAAADFLSDVCEVAPVLLVLDEFGKNLEFYAETGGGADLFVLQEVAERAAGSDGLPLYLLTLQHLAFEDYATGASVGQRREWAKVQGRFEDIPYTDAPSELLELIARVFHVTDERLGKRVERWAKDIHQQMTVLGLGDQLRSAQLLAECYPLHPLTLAVLPELCSRYGQRERTLFSFLARPEPNSVPSFLEEQPVRTGELASVGLDQTYDYFVGSAGTILGTADGASRWLEVDSRIRETQGLSDLEVRCLKVIGVLNLVSRGGALRASAGLIAAALPDVAVEKVIAALEKRGIVVYREFADEYRIWQGSDFDLQGSIDEARRRLINQPLAELCERALPLGPLVAARHSQESGVLRFFARGYVDGANPVSSPTLDSDEDGLLAYVVDGTPAGTLVVGDGASSKPVLFVHPIDSAQLKQAAADAAAVAEVLRTAEALDQDWVARRELHERASLAVERFRMVLADAFDLGAGAVVTSSDGARIEVAENRTWSAVLSSVCDSVFTAAPVIRNEMLARRTLSSQAARARRDLLEAMVQNQGSEKLGIEGYGPERAMLESVLLHTGLYRRHGEDWAFGVPSKSSEMAEVWKAIAVELKRAQHHHVGLDAIWTKLKAPPYGLPDGPIPVLVTCALLANAEDLAIYQDGTFQPLLGVELLERVIKAPDRFTVKHFATAGQRSKVLDAIATRMGLTAGQMGRRNAPLLAVLTPILSTVRSLAEYSRRTEAISERAQAVRRSLLGATEPDDLLFLELPQAVGLQPFPPSGSISDARAHAFAQELSESIEELRGAYPALIDGVRSSLADGLGVPLPASLPDVRASLGSMARTLVDGVFEPRLRSFLIAAGDEHLDDAEWVEYVAMNVAEKPAPAWRDEDHRRFEVVLNELLGAARRVNVLHYERLEAPDSTSVSRQVTVTTPEGLTSAAVIWLDEVATAALTDVVQHAVREADRRLGRRGTEALLALLADEMLSGHGVTPLAYDAPSAPEQKRRRRNA